MKTVTTAVRYGQDMFLSALIGSGGADLRASEWMVTTHLQIPDVCRQRRSCQKTKKTKKDKKKKKETKAKTQLTLSRMCQKQTQQKRNAELLFSSLFCSPSPRCLNLCRLNSAVSGRARRIPRANSTQARVRVCAAWSLNRKRDNSASASTERRGSDGRFGRTQPVFCHLTDARCAMFFWRNKSIDDKPAWVQSCLLPTFIGSQCLFIDG